MNYASQLNRETTIISNEMTVPGPQYAERSVYPADAVGIWHRHINITTTLAGECFDCKISIPKGTPAIYDKYENRVFCIECGPKNEFTPQLTEEQEKALSAGIAGTIALETAPHKEDE